jgi:hypothetical protein
MYNIDIDFEEASKIWRSNKINLGNGCFQYCCQQLTKKNKKCKNKIYKDNFCHLHYRIINSKK